MILGLHHVTAFARDPQANLTFYRDVLGLRFIKKTVNFDDPGVYHFYFSDASASPGSVLTFFPWTGIVKGKVGAGQVSAIAFEVRGNSLDFWKAHLTGHDVAYTPIHGRFGEYGIALEDPDGLPLELIGVDGWIEASGWTTDSIEEKHAILGLAPPTILTRESAPTIQFLEQSVGAKISARQGERTRLSFGTPSPRTSIDVLEDSDAEPGTQGYGTVHHVAFAIEDDPSQEQLRAQIAAMPHPVSPVRDRQYFHSIYFPEPSGVLCEVATNGPGFAIDEAPEALGTALKLPEFLEGRRAEIEAMLPPVS